MKKIVAIHDLSGIGRCSLTVAIPILSALKVQCCPFPTAILSSQTGYPEYTFLDLTNEMNKQSKVWENLKVNFDCIYSGFLGSESQVEIVSNFIKENKDKTEFSLEDIEFIRNAIESHMGEWNTDFYGLEELPLPKNRYQRFVHMCDFLASHKFINVEFENNEIKD